MALVKPHPPKFQDMIHVSDLNGFLLLHRSSFVHNFPYAFLSSHTYRPLSSSYLFFLSFLIFVIALAGNLLIPCVFQYSFLLTPVLVLCPSLSSNHIFFFSFLHYQIYHLRSLAVTLVLPTNTLYPLSRCHSSSLIIILLYLTFSFFFT